MRKRLLLLVHVYRICGNLIGVTGATEARIYILQIRRNATISTTLPINDLLPLRFDLAQRVHRVSARGSACGCFPFVLHHMRNSWDQLTRVSCSLVGS